jgi:predicted ArsR family transcriptional regulator
MAPVLRTIYQAKLQSDLTQTQAEHLRRIASHNVDASLTQAEAGRMLGLNSTSTSTLFSDLQRKGYLVETSTLPTGRRGRPRQQYVLTGPSRLALDAAATETAP